MVCVPPPHRVEVEIATLSTTNGRIIPTWLFYVEGEGPGIDVTLVLARLYAVRLRALAKVLLYGKPTQFVCTGTTFEA